MVKGGSAMGGVPIEPCDQLPHLCLFGPAGTHDGLGMALWFTIFGNQIPHVHWIRTLPICAIPDSHDKRGELLFRHRGG